MIEREQPDLLFECYSLFGYAGGRVAHELGVPLILEVNAPLVEEQAGYSKFPFSRTADLLEPEIFRQADLVVGVSDWIRDFVVSRGANPEQVYGIPNGVGEHFYSEVSGDRVRRELGLVDSLVVGYVGSFQPWHDLAGLLEAYAEISRGRSDLRLLLVGHGPKRAATEELVAELAIDGVVFTGNIEHHLVPEYAAAMDVGVVPFRPMDDFYFSPMKMFEYMAVGTPPVACALGQISDVLEHGRTGWLYPPGDSAALAEGLSTLLDDPGLRASIGVRARDQALRELSWPAVSARILDLAEPLLKRSRSPVT
jgi:glycosyltransferase involved in cell wall biosynthesis